MPAASMNGRELLEQWAENGHPLAIQALDIPHSDELCIEGLDEAGEVFIYTEDSTDDGFYVSIEEMYREVVAVFHDGFAGTALILRTSNVAIAVKVMLELNATIKAVTA